MFFGYIKKTILKWNLFLIEALIWLIKRKKKKKDCSEIHALLLYIFIKRLLTFFSLYLSYDIIAGWNGLH